MSGLLIHDMDSAWLSSDALLLAAAADSAVVAAPGAASLRLIAQSGSTGTTVQFAPAAPLDLTAYDELRFYVRATRPADGSAAAPFYLEFSYVDAGDAAGEEHRWFVPVNAANEWEQRRIGIGADRRSAINLLRFRSLTGRPFTCWLDELLAVSEDMLPDVEAALVAAVSGGLVLPGVSAVPLLQAAAAGALALVLPLRPGFHAGNLIRIEGGSAGVEEHQLTAAQHDTAAGQTTLSLGVGDAVIGNLPAGTATVTLQVPVVVELPVPTTLPSPALLLTHLDAREDLERTTYFTQRDSFRPVGSQVVCSIRPAPRAYQVDYQITVNAPDRGQQVFFHNRLVQRLSIQAGLRINGAVAPVTMLAPPLLDERRTGLPAPLYVRIGSHMQTAARQTVPLVQAVQAETARIDAPQDQEGITIEF